MHTVYQSIVCVVESTRPDFKRSWHTQDPEGSNVLRELTHIYLALVGTMERGAASGHRQ